MPITKQDITLQPSSPEFYEVKEKPVSAYVFGIWAIHHPWPGNVQGELWIITHVPTGRAGYYAYKFTEAIRAAKALAALSIPSMTIDNRGKISIPFDWFRQTVDALQGIEVYVNGPYEDMTPAEHMEKYLQRKRAK